jgi:hypothetical protein
MTTITREMSRKALLTLYNAARGQLTDLRAIEQAYLLLGIRLDTNKIEPYYGAPNSYEPWEMNTLVKDYATSTLWRVAGYTGMDNVYCEQEGNSAVSKIFSPNEITSDMERMSK